MGAASMESHLVQTTSGRKCVYRAVRHSFVGIQSYLANQRGLNSSDSIASIKVEFPHPVQIWSLYCKKKRAKMGTEPIKTISLFK